MGFPCKTCKRTFERKDNLQSHIREVHEGVRAYACDFCDKSCSRKANLEVHLRAMHSVESVLTLPIHSCKLCPKTFRRLGDLTRHKYVKHGEQMLKTMHKKQYEKRKSSENSKLKEQIVILEKKVEKYEIIEKAQKERIIDLEKEISIRDSTIDDLKMQLDTVHETMKQNEVPIKKEIENYICGCFDKDKFNGKSEKSSQNISLQSLIQIDQETENYICGFAENEKQLNNNDQNIEPNGQNTESKHDYKLSKDTPSDLPFETENLTIKTEIKMEQI